MVRYHVMTSSDTRYFFSSEEMNEIVIRPSKKRDKKFDAQLPDGKVVSFGAKGYSDFTLHKDT
jgi:hypothetical protein